MARLDFSHERDLDINLLVRRVEGYFPDADFSKLRRTYEFAAKAHEGQIRSSGERYIIHPLNVAITLVKLRMDMDTICAGLLHDVIEDCNITPEEIEKEFGPSIAEIVVGLTKISKINFKTTEEKQAENFRKMVVAMAKDIRVIIVKLADRMHNMRTLQYVSEEKQKKIAQETLDIYVPLASRLGINSVKSELEDLCLRFLHPEIYYRLAEKVAMKKSEREAYITETIETIKEKLDEYSVKADVQGRPKHFYSIYKKMTSRGVEFEQVQDILAFRIIVSNITECYKCLGIIHSSFTPVPGRFKDYIAIPKINNYQSLHTTVIGPKAERIEIQIRTQEMHDVAETGVAAHWQYKEGIGKLGQKLDWVEDLVEFNKNLKNNSEFMDVVKNDLDIGGIFVFTPDGDVKELKYGSTPLDFAYAIHTEVGNHCVGAKANGRMVSLKYRLKSGETVEVLTSKTQTPNKDWMNIVKTSRAKAKIKQWLLKIEREKNKELGEKVLEETLKLYSMSLKSLKKSGDLEKVLKSLNYKSEEELCIQVGSKNVIIKDVLDLIPSIEVKEDLPPVEVDDFTSYHGKVEDTARKTSRKDNAVIVDGLEDVVVRMAKCCNPIPGDPIVGFVTRGRGITIHRTNCVRKNEMEFARSVRVQWNKDFSFKHPVTIKVMTHDKPGILSKISMCINKSGINIRSAVAKSLLDHKGSFIFEIEIQDYSELLRIISVIEALDEVLSVSRA